MPRLEGDFLFCWTAISILLRLRYEADGGARLQQHTAKPPPQKARNSSMLTTSQPKTRDSSIDRSAIPLERRQRGKGIQRLLPSDGGIRRGKQWFGASFVPRHEWQRKQQLVFDELTQVQRLGQGQNIVLGIRIDGCGSILTDHEQKTPLDLKHVLARSQATLTFKLQTGLRGQVQPDLRRAAAQLAEFAARTPSHPFFLYLRTVRMRDFGNARQLLQRPATLQFCAFSCEHRNIQPEWIEFTGCHL